VIYFRSALVLKVLEDEIPIRLIDVIHATAQTSVVSFLHFRRIGWWKGLWVEWWRIEFQQQLAGDAEKEEGRIPYVSRSYLRHLASDAVNYFVGQVFRVCEPTPSEEFDQLSTDVFILLTRPFAIRVKPLEESIEVVVQIARHLAITSAKLWSTS
jgi:hypothetical protein